MERYLKKGIFLKDEDLIDLYAGILSIGTILPQDKVKTVRYYKISADLGSNYAMVRYARCLSEGMAIEMGDESGEVNLKEAEQYIANLNSTIDESEHQFKLSNVNKKFHF